MIFLNNFLTSGHQFSETDRLQRFHFAFLNSLLLVNLFVTSLYYFACILEFFLVSPAAENMTLFFCFVSLFSIYLLRQKKSYCLFAINFVLLSSLIFIYTLLFFVLYDEFRLIWFFMSGFAGFILLASVFPYHS
ncbi:MAG: hypothetical protein KAH20_16240, partial [Methylococcales bacterium]|nr:hypothetical protein [Methylococcales bacterium]